MRFPSVENNSEHQTPAQPSKLRDDPKFAATKMAIFQYTAVAVFLFLVTGFWELQIKNPEIYNERAERNRIKELPIVAPRGKILDRDGRVIVDNHSTWSLILSRENLKTEHLHEIAEGLHLDYDDLLRKVQRYSRRPKYEPIIIKEELTPSDMAFVASHQDPETFPEMETIESQRRLYPENGVLANVIGYTGEISESELDLPEYAKYNQGQIIGKTGIEKQYNDTLLGIDGERQSVVDNRGREREVLGVKPAVPGKNLQLTIDLDLQVVAELALQGHRGGVVALNPQNGEVLAMASFPNFDPNKFAVRIKGSDWKEITSDPGNPLLNRATQAQWAPGSTFKPIVALAGLESGSIDESTVFHCAGGASYYGHFYKCLEVHGDISLHRGIVESCDAYFYGVGNKTGIDNLAFYAHQVGYGAKTGIDLPNEASGIVPSPEWQMRNYRQKWYLGQTISVSIGQGQTTVTPLQMARAIGGIAVGGVWHTPHLLKAATATEKPHEWALNPDNVKKVVSGMYGVVNEGGTGVRARIPGIEVCGKTGTAQVASADYERTHKDVKDNAWFVAYAPCEKPEIAVAVLWENVGVQGAQAAPTARDVIKAYFDKKERGTDIMADRGRNNPLAALVSALTPRISN
ncbi:MAG TPA: penicillin-binding protein 2 [Bryobacteraceae bacterium]|jgi:penicillin-binding protein 2|nr:penicillin-binding protein 2 [Bryobacteraceae bacterium]